MIASPLLLKWVRVWGKLGASLAHPPLSTSPLHNTALQSLTKLLVKLPEYCCAEPQCLEKSAIDYLGRDFPMMEAGEKLPI